VMTAGGKIAGWAPSAAAPSIEQFGTDYGKYMTAVQEWARNETTAMAEPQRDQYIAQRFADKVIPEINKAAQRGIFATREEVTAMASAGTGYSLEETEEKLGPFIDAAVRASEEEKRLRQQKIEIAQNESEQNQAAIDLMQARVAEINDRIANGDTVRATRLLGELNDFKANLMAREMQSHSMFGLMTEVGMDDAALVYQDNVRKLQETQSWMDQIYPQIQQQLQQVAMVDPVVTGDAIYKQSFTQVYSQIDPMLQTYEQIQEWRASHPERAADYDKAALQLFQDQMTATYGEEGTKKAIAEWKRLAEEYSQ